MTMRSVLHLIWLFTVAICMQEFNNSTTEIPKISTGAHHLVDDFARLFGVFLAVSGIILNFLALEVSKHQRSQTSGSKWIQYLAIWDIVYLLVNGIVEAASQVTGYEVASYWVCRGLYYVMWLGTMNASGHLVALAVDRALNMSFPQWHHMKDWTYINRNLSIGMTLFHAIVLAPMFYVFGVQDGVCDLVSPGMVPRLYQLLISNVLFPVAHFIVILIASFVFEYKLRERRTPGKGTGDTERAKKDDKKVRKTADIGKAMELGNIGNKKLESGPTKNGEGCPNSEPKSSTSTGTVEFIYGGPNNKITMELPTPANRDLHVKEGQNEDNHLATEQKTRNSKTHDKPKTLALKETNVDTELTAKGNINNQFSFCNITPWRFCLTFSPYDEFPTWFPTKSQKMSLVT